MFALFYLIALVASSSCRSLPEDSVVSVYTTQPTTSGTAELDVYQQIAHNIAERISSPFYRFFGGAQNKTQTTAQTKKKTESYELLMNPYPTKPLSNDIETGKERDVEELSEEAKNRNYDKKPEKISLLRYLPSNEHLESTTTSNDIDDFPDISLDDVENTSSPREGPLIFFLELLGSLYQLISGAFEALFKPASSSSSGDKV